MVAYRFEGPGERRVEATKRLWRVLKLASLITSQPRRWKRAGLATFFEVHERSIDRDLELLRAIGYETTRTVDGYAFTRTPALPPIAFSLPEVLTLTLAAGLARDSGDIDTISLGVAMAQLEALVPPSARPLIRFELLQHEARNRPADQRRVILETLQLAWLEQRQVRIVYATASRDGDVTERVVEPYHLQRHYGRFWTLIAFDHHRHAVREFKLSRIRGAALLDEGYTIPDDFSVTAYRGETWGLLRGTAGAPVDVELLFSPQAGRWVQEEDRPTPLTTETLPDGHVLVRLHTGITAETLRWILWYGPDCRVLAPESLRQQVRAMAEATMNVYGGKQ